VSDSMPSEMAEAISLMGDESKRAEIHEKLEGLGHSIDRLLKRAESDIAQKGQPKERAVPRELSLLPPADMRPSSLAVFVEFEELVCTIDTERALFPDAEGSVTDRASRQARLESLRLPLKQAMARIEQAGGGLAPGFQDFAEICCMRGVHLHVLSRGFKDVIRHFLRSAGLGHIPVLANDLVVAPGDGKWAPCFRDSTATGHDKARSMKRAVAGIADARVVLVGSFGCDLGPLEAGLAQHVYAPDGSELERSCEAGGFQIRQFAGWPALGTDLGLM